MFYEVANGHGLPHDPFKAIVAPRPIGWISTRSKSGADNLAPYSFFNGVSGRPPVVMFSSDGRKDSYLNAVETGVFACNFASANLLEKMSATSAPVPYGQSEFDYADVPMAECRKIRASRVATAYACLECKVTQIVNVAGLEGATDNLAVFGQVVAVHIDESVLTDGRFDLAKARPLTRLGYQDYAVVDEIFEYVRPQTAL